MPITAALEAQGVPMAEFEGNVPHALSMASIERPPAPSVEAPHPVRSRRGTDERRTG
jgi:hypothetical protein